MASISGYCLQARPRYQYISLNVIGIIIKQRYLQRFITVLFEKGEVLFILCLLNIAREPNLPIKLSLTFDILFVNTLRSPLFFRVKHRGVTKIVNN